MNLMDSAFNQRKQERERFAIRKQEALAKANASNVKASDVYPESNTYETIDLNESGGSTQGGSKKPVPDIGAKWGITPKDDPPSYTRPESEYSPEEQEKRAKMRAKGVNSDLKAEMDAKVFGKGEAPDGTSKKRGGFWSKVAGTSFGGGWIK